MGANRYTGEVEFTVPFQRRDAKGKRLKDDRTYIFRLDCNRLIRLQDEMGLAENDAEFLVRIDNIKSLKQLRDLMKAGLTQHHPEIQDDEVGEIITALGSTGTVRVMAEAIRWMLPDPQKGGGQGKDAAAESPSPGDDSSATPLEPGSDPTSAMA